MFDIAHICQEAETRWVRHKHGGPRGQAVMPQDGVEYWYALVGYEHGEATVLSALDVLEPPGA